MDFTYRRWPAMPSARPDLIERGDRINALCAMHDAGDRPVFNAIYRLMRSPDARNGERLTRLLRARAERRSGAHPGDCACRACIPSAACEHGADCACELCTDNAEPGPCSDTRP